MRVPAYEEPVNPVGTVTELFAGVGGFRIALARAGWQTVFSNQWEPATRRQHASEVYVRHFGEVGHFNEDIKKLLDCYESGNVKIEPTTLLVGGFPCQDYSVAKTLPTSKGLAGRKGVLWWEILRLVERNRPPLILLENVDRLLKSPAGQRGRDFAIMLASLGDLGYMVEWRVINAAEYGFPQRRKRVFIVARFQKRFPIGRTWNAKDYLTDSGVLARALPVHPLGRDDELSSFTLDGDLAHLTEHFDEGPKSPFKNSGTMVGRTVSSIELAPATTKSRKLGSVLLAESRVPPRFFVPEEQLESWRYLKGSKKEGRVHSSSGFAYEYSEGSMAFPDLLTNPARTVLTGEGGSTPSRFKHIIQTKSGRYRRLTPVELERLNGFPDDWTRYSRDGAEISDSRRAFFMGNALVVGVVERIGSILADDWILKQPGH